MTPQTTLGFASGSCSSPEKDIFLVHTGADKDWTKMLGSRIEAVLYRDRNLRVVIDEWDFDKGQNIVLEMERNLDSVRFYGLVVTRAMLSAPWPTLERSIAVWADPSGALGRVIPLLRENVTLPATLRVRNWIDFRKEERFEEAFAELVARLRGESLRRGKGSLLPLRATVVQQQPYEPTPILITASTEADRVDERLVSNLLRVASLPPKVYYAPTQLRQKQDIRKHCEHPPPFILRDGCLYTFSDLNKSEDLRRSLKEGARVSSDDFADWFSDPEYSRRAIELLNVSLRQHAWAKWLRFDNSRGRYFFAPFKKSRPKRIAWMLGGQRRWREVTTPHTRRVKQEDGNFKEVPFGWRHQGIRANFMLVMDKLMLRIEPTYLLTKDDGKTPRTSRWVGPILSHWLNQERNGQILRSLRFWSLVIARGSELCIETGGGPIVVDLTPVSGMLDFGIASDQMNFDALMQAEIEDDVQVPQLELFGSESAIEHAEDENFPEDEQEQGQSEE